MFWLFVYCGTFIKDDKRQNFCAFLPGLQITYFFNLIINEFILFVGWFVKFSFYLGEERLQVRLPCDANFIIERLNPTLTNKSSFAPLQFALPNLHQLTRFARKIVHPDVCP